MRLEKVLKILGEEDYIYHMGYIRRIYHYDADLWNLSSDGDEQVFFWELEGDNKKTIKQIKNYAKEKNNKKDY